MGPTAVGKTEVAVSVAESIGGEIVSADSMQIYRGLDIGAAKPSAETLARVPHHMVDIADPAIPYSVYEYRKAAGEAVRGILSRGGVPVIAGGTGLYIHSLIYDMDFGEVKGNESVRAEYERLAAERGKEFVHDLLAERDPAAAERIHPNNLKRVIRALERIPASPNDTNDTGGQFFCAESATQKNRPPVSRPFGFDLRKGKLIDPVMILLTRDRVDLVERIGARVDAMMEKGLAREVERLAGRGLTREHISMLGIGYKETLGYLNGEYGLGEAAELIKIHTRRYAKRQMTWFKRYKDAQVIDLTATGADEAAARISSLSARKPPQGPHRPRAPLQEL
jgi:tRNA dimethylallyltransferase